MSDGEHHPRDYTQTFGVRVMSRLPRFGHGSDFSKLASSDQEEQTDYAVGVLSVSFFIASVFIFWCAVILALKCMSRRRVGFCAGRVRLYADAKGHFRIPFYLSALKCSFMTAGCCVVLLSFALVGPGLQSLEVTSASTHTLNRDVRDLMTQGLLIIDQVRRVKWNIGSLDVESILRVEEACPRLENNTFVTDKRLRNSINQVESEFDELRDYLEQSDLEGIRQRLGNAMDGTEHIEAAVTVVEKNDWIIRMYGLVLNVLVFFLLLAAALGGKCRMPALSCMTRLLILPLFAVAIACSWLAASVLAFASVSNADFCTGNSQQSGPAGTMADILEERAIRDGDIIYDAFAYYQSGCETEDPIKHLYRYEDDLQSGVGSANEFLTKVDEIGIDEINDQCGADVSPIIEGITLIKDNLGILLSVLRSTFDLASCKRMRPVYMHAFEGTACTDSFGSLSVLFVITLTIGVVGMIMITLRSALYPSERVWDTSSTMDDDYERDEWEEYQAYLEHMASFVNMWGGGRGGSDEDVTKTGTSETSSFSSSDSVHCSPEGSSTEDSDEDLPDEETPLSPHTPSIDTSSFRKARTWQPGTEGDDRQGPPSPCFAHSAGSMIRMHGRSRTYAPRSKHADDDSNDECAPLTPQTASASTASVGCPDRRAGTPDYVSPGTFRRWRRHDDEDVLSDGKLPEVPLMVPPAGPRERGNYFGGIISPLRRSRLGEAELVKTE